MSDNVIGCFSVAFRLCCNPGPFQLLLGLLSRLRENKPVPRINQHIAEVSRCITVLLNEWALPPDFRANR